jgi:plasmid stability protein
MAIHTPDMLIRMKTTLNIDEATMRRLKVEAAARGVTMSALVEAALRRLLDEKEATVELPALPHWQTGGLLVDVSSRDALYAAMGGR